VINKHAGMGAGRRSKRLAGSEVLIEDTISAARSEKKKRTALVLPRSWEVGIKITSVETPTGPAGRPWNSSSTAVCPAPAHIEETRPENVTGSMVLESDLIF